MFEVPASVIHESFGLPATVTRPAPDDDPIETTIVWIPWPTEDVPGGDAMRGAMTLNRREPRRVLSLRRDEVPTVPNKTRIVGPELAGGPDRAWKVDTTERSEADMWRVVVIPAPDET